MKTNAQIPTLGAVTGAPRRWLRTEGLVFFILSILLYSRTVASWWLFPLLLLSPDVAMAGYWINPRIGAIAYNMAHSYLGPLVWAGAALSTSHETWLPYPLIWAAHVGMDRALGYGLKYPEAFKSTHLGRLGPDQAA